MHEIIRILVYPISLLYGIGVWVRNLLYDKGLFLSYTAPVPTIVIGNLTVGGTGKTPHAEYLIKLLRGSNNVAYLSRGYGRRTTGLRILNSADNSITAGDEPIQIFQKFPDISVVVSENRIKAIKKLYEEKGISVFILDDAFQHRAVNPGLSILLTDYNKIFTKNYLIPTGTLREGLSGVKRANIIIVTKTPVLFSPLERRRVESEIKLKNNQHLFFSYMQYGNLVPFTDAAENLLKIKDGNLNNDYAILLVSGIANPLPLRYHLSEIYKELHEIEYRDHHIYTKSDIEKIKHKFNGILRENKIIITTEKDKIRFQSPEIKKLTQGIPMFYLPIEICFQDNDKALFDKLISSYVNKQP